MKYNREEITMLGKRDEQQDSIASFETASFLSATVCDGMGGLSRGAEASKTAVETMRQLLEQTDGEIGDVPTFLLKCVDFLDSSVRRLPREESERIGTTLVSAIFQNNQLFWVSVGDSRLYIYRQGEMIQATRDHNFQFTLDQLRAKNQITDEQYVSGLAKGGALTSFIGMGNIEFMDICQSPFWVQDGDIFLLTTDGLYKALSDETICTVLRESVSLMDAAITLEARVNEYDHPAQDNTSFILIEAVADGQTLQMPHSESIMAQLERTLAPGPTLMPEQPEPSAPAAESESEQEPVPAKTGSPDVEPDQAETDDPAEAAPAKASDAPESADASDADALFDAAEASEAMEEPEVIVAPEIILEPESNLAEKTEPDAPKGRRRKKARREGH